MLSRTCKIFLFVLTIAFFLQINAKEKVKICADDNIQIPFIMILKDRKPIGVHVDILNEVFTNTNLTYSLELIPWIRCLDRAKAGEYDIVLNASYDEKRAEYLNYPSDSGPNEEAYCSSIYKLGCYGYYVLTLKNTNYDYTGEVSKLPFPIRVARGNSAEKELLATKNLQLESGKSDSLNIKKMIRDNTGCAVVYSAYTNFIDIDLKDKIKIHKIPYKLKSYYLAFSKNSKIDPKNITFIWKKLNKVVSDKENIKKIFNKYNTFYGKSSTQ
ncbi:transporter substrate-binding domain-containing protein [Pigmentibacter sp. JX0631]|uniref:substrate-binding periplasmic protein n=1 Tax=Pigmentibacter sp. JX0631 TaxID=2976982 RepID=UPI0024694327|nr:transporter substrate-binding domain-containing protein [Pigmentibacter sp. JX0631]WGL58544.1 transporter substrate-binding domain-containing protein [Pigmentibacter sp. JX0631]